MFDEFNDDGLVPLSNALDALSDLERNTSHAIVAQRSSKRIDIQTKVFIQAGNSSQRGKIIETLSADISNGGCMLLSPCPLMVGDIFWLQFPEEHIQLESLMARCVRCRLVSEDAFEVGIRFFTDVDIATIVSDTFELSV